MIDSLTERRLQDLVRREGRSLLQYVGQAFPWAAADDQAVLATLKSMVAEEWQAIGNLVRLLIRRRITPPYFGAFPSSFTTINFTSVKFLLPMLLGAQKLAIERLESEVKSIDDEEAAALVQHLIDIKKKHLSLMDALAAARPAGSVA